MSDQDRSSALAEAFGSGILDSIQEFWFQHLADETHIVVPSTEDMKVWFMDKSDEFDSFCRDKYGNILTIIKTSSSTPEEILAAANPTTSLNWMSLIILLDQLPRNIYRGTSASIISHTFDPLALAIALKARAQYIHLDPSIRYRLSYRLWVFMPFEHAEDLEMQEIMVREQRARWYDMQDHLLNNKVTTQDSEITKYCRSVVISKQEELETCTGLLKKAVDEHYEAIKRFGRFPYRNKTLGRETTREEQEFLDAM
ncbi:unnamed protein product [Aureobasidium uvarum]|uniref:DUF924-domain-containing protein n=1 Tax=Aureobasidium uvarum TaxID=2773716 RepID=A0A9N8KGT5_9PEZI|nr:unnamed protein product [Aureobasidium uvarum]